MVSSGSTLRHCMYDREAAQEADRRRKTPSVKAVKKCKPLNRPWFSAVCALRIVCKSRSEQHLWNVYSFPSRSITGGLVFDHSKKRLSCSSIWRKLPQKIHQISYVGHELGALNRSRQAHFYCVAANRNDGFVLADGCQCFAEDYDAWSLFRERQ